MKHILFRDCFRIVDNLPHSRRLHNSKGICLLKSHLIQRCVLNVNGSFGSKRSCSQSDETSLNEYLKKHMKAFREKTLDPPSVSDFNCLIHNDQDEKKVKEILDIYEQSKNDSQLPVPKTLIPLHMENLLHIYDNRVKLLAYLGYVYRCERSYYRSKLIKEFNKNLKSKEVVQEPGGGNRVGILFDEQGCPKYGLWSNGMFVRRCHKAFNSDHQRKLRESALFGQKIVFDFAYQELMPPADYVGVCKQMQNVFVANYEDENPYDLWLCNLPENSRMCNKLRKVAPLMFDSRSLCSITDKPLLELDIPLERLVYLSPDAPDKLDTYNPDDVYVLGAFVDRNDNRPESLNKARINQIRTARLPLEDHLIWNNSNFNLPMYSVFRMLLHMKWPLGCWKHAILQFAPKCKQLDEYETLAKYQPKVFNQLLKSKYAYVNSRKEIRDRLLVNKIAKNSLAQV